MTEEQIFKERFSEYCVGESCLSPYFDLFQAGFQEGEKQNKEIQEGNASLRHYHNCGECEAFRFCSQKPNREDYEDENKYLIDLECGVWSCENTIKLLVRELQEAKIIIQDLLSNSDEYARQRAIDFLKEE